MHNELSMTPSWSPVRIRPFGPNDQPAARTMILAGLGEHFGHVNPALNPDLDYIAASYLDRGHIFLVATIGAALVGTGGLCITGKAGQIVQVSVARSYRRRGLGQRMVTALLAETRGRGVTRVWMETIADWEDALGLYRRCGFREFNREDGCIFMGVDLSCNQTVIRA